MDFTTHKTDRIMATGTVTVAGRINLSMLNIHQIRSGTTWQPVFDAMQGLTNAGVTLNAPESIVVDFDLYKQPGELGVVYDVDFAAHGKLDGNRVSMGEYLNRVQRFGEATGVGDVVTSAVLETDIDRYSSMLTQLDTEFYAEQQAVALGGVQRFARNLQNCGTLVGGEIVGDATGCIWGRYDDIPSSRESFAGFPSAEHEGTSISTGVQKPIDDAWTFGVALDYSDQQSSGYDHLWSAASHFMQLGGTLRRDVGRGSVGATLQLGKDSQDVMRNIDVTAGYRAQGEREVHLVSSVLDYTADLAYGGFDFQPGVNFGISRLDYRDMAETGAGGQNAVIFGSNETHLWVEPAVAARYTANFVSGSSLRTFARVGLLQYFSGTSTEVHAGLAGAPAHADPMIISSDLDRTHWVGELGLQYQAINGFTLGVSYSHQESDIREGGSGSLRFALPLK
jgi:autotransporter-like protein